ncbi:MAG: hypothetical protein JXQ90_18915 [Cyclobacteriaceae bacterium]
MLICLVTISYVSYQLLPSRDQLIRLINEQLPTLEYSTELLFQSDIKGIQLLRQHQLLETQIDKPELNIPISWRLELGLVLLALAVSFAQFTQPNKNITAYHQETSTLSAEVATPVADTTYIKSISTRVTPPKYTGLLSYTSNDTQLKIAEGSMVEFIVDFEGDPDRVWIKSTEKKNFELKKENDHWTTVWKPRQSGFYQYIFIAENEIISSQLASLTIVKDEAPTVSITEIPPFQRLIYAPNLYFSFKVEMADDYGLTNGYVVATTTKGSGESVKFREQKLPFNKPVEGRESTISMTLSSDELDLEPGNELYFYAMAMDNHEPTAQMNKTETFFIVLEDTSEVEFSLQGNLGVDIMPDYFRSQLQIIIDTKKLIAERNMLTKQKFNETSNALGFDQKQLRLKYGQFIGEEEDSGLEIEQEEPLVEANGEVDVLQEFGHDTDHENEEGQLMDKGTYQNEHDHADEVTDPESPEDPLEAYLHDHEDAETATFFTQTLKTKLRAALNEMWDAELYLRLYQPASSLPYQEAALKLLNEIKNHARIYVQRIGFDPPPIKESESRLSRTVEDPNTRPFNSEMKDDEMISIKKLLIAFAQITTEGTQANTIKPLLNDAGSELAKIAIDQPGKYLKELNAISVLSNKNHFNDVDIGILGVLTNKLSVVINEEIRPSSHPTYQNPLNARLQKLILEQ